MLLGGDDGCDNDDVINFDDDNDVDNDDGVKGDNGGDDDVNDDDDGGDDDGINGDDDDYDDRLGGNGGIVDANIDYATFQAFGLVRPLLSLLGPNKTVSFTRVQGDLKYL